MAATQDIQALYHKLTHGDRVALGQAITLVESRKAEHRAQANALLDKCLTHAQETFRFAVSGAPGVGKSTFIETLGHQILAAGHKLAVLAIDPTSSVSRGAILGDKTRMEALSRHPDVFIRPTSAGSTLGGVADRTREAIALCEAAGYDRICVETVGVGQSETEAHHLTDYFLLLVLPGGGDDLQGIKKGIVEMADLIAVNKSDGIHKDAARQTQRFYAQAVHFFAPKAHGQTTRVLTCSALESDNVDTIWAAMRDFHQETQESGYHSERRNHQNLHWLGSRAAQLAQTVLLEQPAIKSKLVELREAVHERSMSVSSALGELEQFVLNSIHQRHDHE